MLSAKEVMEEMKKRGTIVYAVSITPVSVLVNTLGLAGFFLCILPAVYIYTEGQLFLEVAKL